jgi:hypothetical protein
MVAHGLAVAPNPEQYATLQKARELATLENTPATIASTDGTAKLEFILPRQGVSLLLVELRRARVRCVAGKWTRTTSAHRNVIDRPHLDPAQLRQRNPGA